MRHVGLGVPPRPEMFLSALQAPLLWLWTTVVVKTQGDPASLGDTVKTAIRSVDPTIAVHRIATLDDVVSQSIVEPRIYTMLLGAFATLAVLLATIGLYGLIAYSRSARTSSASALRSAPRGSRSYASCCAKACGSSREARCSGLPAPSRQRDCSSVW